MKKISSILLWLISLGLYADVMPVIDIVYHGEKASVTIPADAPEVSLLSAEGSTQVRLDIDDTCKTEYCFRVSGSTSAGSLQIIGDYKLRLELAGVDIASQSGAAINIACGKRIDVVLKDGTSNVLKDGTGGSQKAAMYFSGHPEFKGNGSLIVTGNTNHAISAKEYLLVKNGNIQVLGAVNDGIHCGKGKQNNANNYFQIDDGKIVIQNVGGDCIDSDDFGTMRINGGEIDMEVNHDGGRGLKCDSVFTMTDGVIRAALSGGYDEINDNRCMAVNVGQDMSVTGGTINVSLQNDQAKAYKVKGNICVMESGKIVSSGNHFMCNAADYELDMQLYAQIVCDGKPIKDYANYQVGAFLGETCCGAANMMMVKGNVCYADMRLHSNQGGEHIKFMVYDASKKKEFVAKEEVSFVNNATKGRPGAPYSLHIITKEPGDVNGDGVVGLADAVALINFLNGNELDSYNHETADINGDGEVNVLDVKMLIDTLLK